VYPPVDVERFAPSEERSGRFLVVSRLVASKRVELAVEAANRHALPLDIIGKGPELKKLQRMAGPTVRVLGWQPDTAVRREMAACEALVVPAEEDFGLVMAEAQASGRPPVALAQGGALEIIESGATGFLFDEQTPDAIAEAMQRARSSRLDVADLRDSAARFDLPVFAKALQDAVDAAMRDSKAAVSAWR
jgi:glycosyltransferase involved in cell wall biosynthesis